jgi:predicted phage terminase large subunit-like protein
LKILIEGIGVGTALIAELKDAGFNAIPAQVQHNKQTRMFVETEKFEAGRVPFLHHAPWLADLEAELSSFP